MKTNKKLILVVASLLLITACDNKDNMLENFTRSFDSATVITDVNKQVDMLDKIANLQIGDGESTFTSYAVDVKFSAIVNRASGYLVHQYYPLTEKTIAYVNLRNYLEIVSADARVENDLFNIRARVLGINLVNIENQPFTMPKGSLNEIVDLNAIKSLDSNIIKSYKTSSISSGDIKTLSLVYLFEIDQNYINERINSDQFIFTSNPTVGIVLDSQLKLLMGFTLVGNVKLGNLVNSDINLIALDVNYLQIPEKPRY
jgi:hypothetical protein